MSEKLNKAVEEPQSEKDGDTYEEVKKNMENEAWVIEHWEELGESGQQWAFMIHGQDLWQKILDS